MWIEYPSASLWFASLAASVAAAIATRRLSAAMLPKMRRSVLVVSNYRGRPVPSTGGAVPVLVACATLLMWHAWPAQVSSSWRAGSTACVLAMLGFAFVGLLDDALGDRSAGGLRGHWRRIAAGDVTTGGIKAVFGVIVAVAAAGPLSGSAGEVLLNAFLIAGSANAVNLFDVRPGRALKFWGVLALLLWAGSWRHPGWIVVLPAFVAVGAFAPDDLGGRAMLGDGGANAAGALLGVIAAWSGGLALKAVLVLGLAVLHVATERVSITEVIRTTPWLQKLDEWGTD